MALIVSSIYLIFPVHAIMNCSVYSSISSSVSKLQTDSEKISSETLQLACHLTASIFIRSVLQILGIKLD